VQTRVRLNRQLAHLLYLLLHFLHARNRSKEYLKKINLVPLDFPSILYYRKREEKPEAGRNSPPQYDTPRRDIQGNYE
jgi:hypothetical protein